MTRPRIVALMGPTASGKTATSIKWAKAHDGEIVSVDSALVYRHLDIGSAKPSMEERDGVPHHLIDVRDPWQTYSAAEFANDAHAAIVRVHDVAATHDALKVLEAVKPFVLVRRDDAKPAISWPDD